MMSRHLVMPAAPAASGCGRRGAATSGHSQPRTLVAVALLALVCAACGAPPAPTGPTPAPVTTPSPPLRITAFSVTESVEGSTYTYEPTLTLTAGADAVTVTELWVELEDRSNGFGRYLRDPRLPHRIPAAATHQLFENPPAYFEGNDLRATQVWAVVTYVDDSGRSARLQTPSVAPRLVVAR
jgi:hypothetical protein